MVEQIGETPVLQISGHPIEHQQSTGATFSQRMTSDQRLGKLEMEIGDTHDEEASFSGRKAYRKAPQVTTRHD